MFYFKTEFSNYWRVLSSQITSNHIDDEIPEFLPKLGKILNEGATWEGDGTYVESMRSWASKHLERFGSFDAASLPSFVDSSQKLSGRPQLSSLVNTVTFMEILLAVGQSPHSWELRIRDWLSCWTHATEIT